MSNVGRWRIMSTAAKPGTMQLLSKLTLIVLCAFGVLSLCSCAAKSGDEGVVEHAVKYANVRTVLDLAKSSAVLKLPDAEVVVSVMNFDDTSPGEKEIELECAVVSDTMASWSADEWAENRDDLFFNLAAHFNVVCKQAHEFGDLPEGYVVTCPDYMVVYNSQKSRGFIVSATGVYRKTTDPENPLGEPITQVTQDAALSS